MQSCQFVRTLSYASEQLRFLCVHVRCCRDCEELTDRPPLLKREEPASPPPFAQRGARSKEGSQDTKEGRFCSGHVRRHVPRLFTVPSGARPTRPGRRRATHNDGPTSCASDAIWTSIPQLLLGYGGGKRHFPWLPVFPFILTLVSLCFEDPFSTLFCPFVIFLVSRAISFDVCFFLASRCAFFGCPFLFLVPPSRYAHSGIFLFLLCPVPPFFLDVFDSILTLNLN